ncbi:type II toxin-antitoxin system VapC family toxin [Agromyces aerolatus]|uniref:type II toxin-antitoxin system VapC family toxin n=1 Tax=Agromyces sp. LY-1074 TaxID=3074080 RepID=UPI002866CB6A|nr:MULTISPECIES: type II toxin-antitoxin system VapC family toxin [unclassified Agromyces]MDR5698880.1 type II toxin-antitoxin system VapC family toxin [Agromyces sp. LY-1074]MDR5705342.1 type II toxin-antitoxin system VapC family toxin [Agromyces sp. LY-1358]
MIILDTNVISEVFRREPDTRVVSWLESIDDDVAITAITLAELLAGVRRLPMGRRRSVLVESIERAVQPYRDTRSVLSFDDRAADHYADILDAREKSGQPISMADAQIASICRARNAVCATRNTRDFDRTGIELVNPWDAVGSIRS